MLPGMPGNNGNGHAPKAPPQAPKITINSHADLANLHATEMAGRGETRQATIARALGLTNNFGPTDMVRGNLFNLLLDGPRDIDSECGYPPWLTPDHYRFMYDREGIARRVVDCEPDETWTDDPELFEDDDPEVETPFEAAWNQLLEEYDLWHWMHRVDILSGIGQFGILLLMIDDGRDLREPIDGVNDDGTFDPGVPHRLLNIRAFDETVVFVKVREIDVTSPRYSLPKVYTVQFRDYPNWGVQAGEIIARDIHWSRVVHVADNRKMSEVYGIPRMQPVYNRLYDLRKVYSSSGEAYWKGAFPGIAFEVNPELADQGIELDTESLKQQMADFQNGLQRYLAIQGVSAKSLPPTIVDPNGTAEAHLKAIAIAKDIPYRVLFGSEEAVLAGNQDSRKWNKKLARRQTNYVNPMIIRPFVDRLIGMGILPPPKDGYQIEWPDLNAPTDEDKANIAAMATQAMAAYVQGGVSSLMAPREFLTHVMEYDPDEADAILEASSEFAGDEDEPLSAAGQQAMQMDQMEAEAALMPQPAAGGSKGGKGGKKASKSAKDKKGKKKQNTRPTRNLAANAADPTSLIWHNPDRPTLQALHDTVGALRGVVSEDGKNHNWGSANHFIHHDLIQGGHSAPSIQGPHHLVNVSTLGNRAGKILLDGTSQAHHVPGIGNALVPPKRPVRNASLPFDVDSYTGIGHPNPLQPDAAAQEGKVQLWRMQNGAIHTAPAVGQDHSDVWPDITQQDTSGRIDHARKMISVAGEERKVAVAARQLGKMHPDYEQRHFYTHNSAEPGDSGGMEPTDNAWQDGWKAADKPEPAHQIMKNPDKSSLQGLLDTVHHYNSEHSIDYSPLKIVLRGAANDDGSKHNWGSSFEHEHRGLKQGDNSLEHHLYVKTSGEIVKMGRGGDFEPHPIPGIGSKLKPVKAMVANATDAKILDNPSKGELQAHLDSIYHARVDRNPAYAKRNEPILRGAHDEATGTHRWGDSYDVMHHELLEHGKPMSPASKPLFAYADGKINDREAGAKHDVPGIGKALAPVKKFVANELQPPRKHGRDQQDDQNEYDPTETNPGANPDNGDALWTPNLAREGIKHPVDPEMIQLPSINAEGEGDKWQHGAAFAARVNAGVGALHADAKAKSEEIAGAAKSKYQEFREAGSRREEAASAAATHATEGHGFSEETRQGIASHIHTHLSAGWGLKASGIRENATTYFDHEGRTGLSHNPLDPTHHPDRETAIRVEGSGWDAHRANTPVQDVYDRELAKVPKEHRDWVLHRADQRDNGTVSEKKFIPKPPKPVANADEPEEREI